MPVHWDMKAHPEDYDFGGWEQLIRDRAAGKNIHNYTSEQQASMIEKYGIILKQLSELREGEKSPDSEYLKSLLKEFDVANQALDPFIRQLARESKESDVGFFSGEIPYDIDLSKERPPAPGLPPASYTGIVKPLPEIGGPKMSFPRSPSDTFESPPRPFPQPFLQLPLPNTNQLPKGK